MREYFKNLPDKSTPLTAPRLNRMLNGEEAIEKIVVGDIECKNLFDKTVGAYINSYSTYTPIDTGFRITSTAVGSYRNSTIKILDLRKYEGRTMTVNTSVSGTGEASLEVSRATANFEDKKVLGYPDGFKPLTFNIPSVSEMGDSYYLFVRAYSAGSTSYPSGSYIDYENFQIEVGSTATEYTPYKKIGYNSQDSMGEIVVDDISCKNLFNKIWKAGWIRYNDGAIMDSGLNSFGYTDYIEVEPNTTYTINFHDATQLQDGGIMQYDSSKNLIGSGIAETGTVMTFKTTATTKYLIFTFRQDSIDKVQLEKGTVATEYTPYKEFDSSLYINVGEETPTNEYIGNNRVYVKKVSITALPKAGSITANLGLSNVIYTRIIGCAVSGNVYIPLPYADTNHIALYINNNVLTIASATDRSSYSGYVDVYYTKN